MRFTSATRHAVLLYRDVARDLAHALEMNWVSAGEFQEIGEGRGDMPIDDTEVIVFTRLSSLRWRMNPVQPRRGGRMALRARTGGIDVYNVHLASSGADAVSQLRDVFGRAWSPHRHPIDWILVRGLGAGSGQVPRIAGISDHCPVVASLWPADLQ